MSKQTAVEWFAQQLGITSGTMFNKAKAIEREQIESAFNSGTNFDAFRPDCPAGNTYYETMYEKRRVMIADLKDFFNFSKYVNNKYKGGEQ